MNEHPTADELAAFFSGKLPPERSRQVDAHLDTCDVCRALTDKRPPVPIAPRVGESHPAMPDGYKFKDELGRGGMGVVYLATRLSDGAQVVIKTLSPDKRGDSKLAGYLEREATLTAKVHSIRVLSGAQLRPFSPTDPTPYIEFPWVPSTPMGKMIGTPMSFVNIPLLVGWVIQCCRALEGAHHRSPAIIHFDLKPENVLVQNKDSEAVLIDFGLACEWPPPNGETRTGCGTYEYMAPEVADPGRSSLIGTQTDVFALGGMLCAILTGKPPYARTDFHNSKTALLEAARTANLKPAFDRLDACHEHLELVAFSKRCLSVEPSNRPRDAQAVRQELERLVRPRHRRGQWRAWAAVLTSLLAVGLVTFQLLRLSQGPGNMPVAGGGDAGVVVSPLLEKVRQRQVEARTWLEDAKEAGTAVTPKWNEDAKKAGTLKERMDVRKKWDDFAQRLEDHLKTLEDVEQRLKSLLDQTGKLTIENPPVVPDLPAHPPLVEVIGWRHYAFGREQGGGVTPGLVWGGNYQWDVIASYPLVELPVPRRVKSLQLRRQKPKGDSENITVVMEIEGKGLDDVAAWGGTVRTWKPLGAKYPDCRLVHPEEDPRKTGEWMATGGEPLGKPPGDPSEGNHYLRHNPPGNWASDATTQERIKDHRDHLSKWVYSWSVTYADGNRETISLKDKGPATAKP